MTNDYGLLIIGRWLSLLLVLFPFASRGKVGQVTYFTYYDAETKSELYHVLIKTWQKF